MSAWLVGPTVEASQMVWDGGFAQENEAIVVGLVLDVRDESPALTGTPVTEPAMHCGRCRARVSVQEVIKDGSGHLGTGDTITVAYVSGCWTELPPVFTGIDARGDSIYSSTFILGCSDQLKLEGGDCVLLGLALSGDEYRPGRGGFTAPLSWIPVVRSLVLRP